LAAGGRAKRGRLALSRFAQRVEPLNPAGNASNDSRMATAFRRQAQFPIALGLSGDDVVNPQRARFDSADNRSAHFLGTCAARISFPSSFRGGLAFAGLEVAQLRELFVGRFDALVQIGDSGRDATIDDSIPPSENFALYCRDVARTCA